MSDVDTTGFSFIGITKDGELELDLIINEHRGRCYVSRDLWLQMAKHWDQRLIERELKEAQQLNSLEASLLRGHRVFKALHAVYHERDFRVRVNDFTIDRVRRALAQAVGREDKEGSCPACAAGFDYD